MSKLITPYISETLFGEYQKRSFLGQAACIKNLRFCYSWWLENPIVRIQSRAPNTATESLFGKGFVLPSSRIASSLLCPSLGWHAS